MRLNGSESKMVQSSALPNPTQEGVQPVALPGRSRESTKAESIELVRNCTERLKSIQHGLC